MVNSNFSTHGCKYREQDFVQNKNKASTKTRKAQENGRVRQKGSNGIRCFCG